MLRMSYPRRPQFRRLRRAVASGAAGLAAGALAVVAASAGATPDAGMLILVTVGLLIHARHWMRRVGRSGVGARSEDEVRRALAALEAEGWRLRHSLPYRGRGDIDSVAIAPTGDRIRNRDQDPNVRRSPSRRYPGDGGMAVPPAAALVSLRSTPRPVRRARQRAAARPGRGPDRVA
jgi:hypothetical protein